LSDFGKIAGEGCRLRSGTALEAVQLTLDRFLEDSSAALGRKPDSRAQG
jgi:hypothetical protein